MPLRGMLGNGLRVVVGAVVAFNGTLVVETRGLRLQLAVDERTGRSKIADFVPCEARRGLRV
jgi:hypothetical protein